MPNSPRPNRPRSLREAIFQIKSKNYNREALKTKDPVTQHNNERPAQFLISPTYLTHTPEDFSAMTEEKVPTNALTKRQATAHMYICNYMLEFGYPPTIREIGDHMEIKSTNGVNDHLKAIERKGYITRVEAKSRAIRPLYMPDKRRFEEWQFEKQNMAHFDEANQNLDEEIMHVPLVGKIAAGTPISAIENRENTLHLGASLLKRANDVFALRVSGDSMIEDGIHNGDILFVKKTQTAPDGTIVGVLVDSEATVKRLYHEEDGRIRLQPANKNMEPIYIDPAENRETSIIGVVISLYRNL